MTDAPHQPHPLQLPLLPRRRPDAAFGRRPPRLPVRAERARQVGAARRDDVGAVGQGARAAQRATPAPRADGDARRTRLRRRRRPPPRDAALFGGAAYSAEFAGTGRANRRRRVPPRDRRHDSRDQRRHRAADQYGLRHVRQQRVSRAGARRRLHDERARPAQRDARQNAGAWPVRRPRGARPPPQARRGGAGAGERTERLASARAGVAGRGGARGVGGGGARTRAVRRGGRRLGGAPATAARARRRSGAPPRGAGQSGRASASRP